MSEQRNDDLASGLNIQDEADFRIHQKAIDLDPYTLKDKAILDELAMLNKWSGLSSRVVYGKNGTAAHGNGYITLNQAELKHLFRSLGAEAFRTAVFLALAHEAAHQTQFLIFGFNETMAKNRREVEAHADFLAGVWLGVCLAEGKLRLPDDVRNAAMQLTGMSADYPTANQRAALFLKGMSQAGMIVTTEERARIEAGTLKDVLTEQDVQDTLEIAKQTLDETLD